ncbi:MAG: sigma-54 dependent transcriptional regulator [Bacteroides sp.]|nr:sigma-54 dependent transcriptional regulator [Bacteroides sp.]
MAKQGTLLIIDDNKGVLTAVSILLSNHYNRILTLSSPVNLLSLLKEEKVDIVLLDMNFTAGINTGNEGLYWLGEIKRSWPELPVILITAYADIDLAVKGIQEGAADFIVKPWDNTLFLQKLEKVFKGRNKKRKITDRATDSSMFWGDSAAMRQLRGLTEKVAITDANVLITGENGTGKEMLAREIHHLSARNHKPMISVDMGAVTETLFESELFGHAKGSFTDAHSDRTGKFEAADGGSIFLDEIGNLPWHLQAKLLTVIQQKSVVKVGSNLPLKIDIRLICATNRNLSEMVEKKEFREDLLYRINTIHLEIPPLRERIGDIIPLAEIFIKRYAAQYNKSDLTLSESAAEKLIGHPWYGNIRELQHTLEKAVILSDGALLTPELFQLTVKKGSPTIQQATTLEDMGKNMIRKAIDNCNGNLSAVAVQLGITRQTLYNKMKKFGL